MFGKKYKQEDIIVEKITPIVGQFITYMNKDDNSYCEGYVTAVYDERYFVRTAKAFDVQCKLIKDDEVILHTSNNEPVMAPQDIRDMCDRRAELRSRKIELNAESEIEKMLADIQEAKQKIAEIKKDLE